MTIKDTLQKIDRYMAAIRAYRPLSEAEVRELDAYYRIGTTYSSNALEGNSLTLSETKVLLEDGITVGGKPIRDCYEATGHAKAYDYMLAAARGGPLSITEELICRRGAGAERQAASCGICRLYPPPSGGYLPLSGWKWAHSAAFDESQFGQSRVLSYLHSAGAAA